MTQPDFDPLQTIVAAKGSPRDVRVLPRLLRYGMGLALRAGRRPLLSTLALQLTAAIVAGAQVLLVERALTPLLTQDDAGAAVRGAAVPILVLLLLNALTSTSVGVLEQRGRLLGDLVQKYVWDLVFSVTSRVPLVAFEDDEFYNQVQRVQTHALVRPLNLAQGLVGLVGGVVGALTLVVVLTGVEPLLVPLLLLGTLPLLALARTGGNLEFDFSVAQTPQFRERDYLRQVLVGRDQAQEVRTFQLAGWLRRRHEALYGDYIAALQRHLGRRTRLLLLGAAASAAAAIVTVGLLLFLVQAGRIGIAEAGAAVLGVRLLAVRLQTLSASLGKVFESALFLTDLRAFLATPVPAPVDRSIEQHVAPLTPRLIEVEDVHFAYPGTSEPALSGVDVRIERGQVLALVGENGSGKSTLAKVLLGLYAPTRGRVLWDGVPLEDLPAEQVAASMAPVFQEFVRYQLPARSNISLGRVDVPEDEDEVHCAAAAVGVHELLRGLPEGYETKLSRAFLGGRDLSGGQWQRIAIARAFYRDAPVLVLDEPSAALDPKAEQALFRQLKDLYAGRTVIYVSHRFATVREADQILVLQHGRVVERGRHDELMAVSGTYAELFLAQAEAFVDLDERPASR